MEFGEKVKQLREENGMTQQTMAEQLYVTRQAVSCWECGARFPDLLTTKKIAQILEVSVDELISGEELKKNIEKEPVLAKPVANIFQTILYTIASVAYMLMCLFSIYSFLPNEALTGTPAGKISMINIVTVCGYILNFLAVATGLIFAMCIIVFFVYKKRLIPHSVIFLISIVSFGYIFYTIALSFTRITDLGFVVRTVHALGKTGMILLLAYQAFIWEKTRTAAYKI